MGHRFLVAPSLAVSAVAFALAGCGTIATPEEERARNDERVVEHIYRPGGERPDLPALQATSPLGDFLRFAVLNQPQVEAAYFDWIASIRRITVERSPPDPRLTFQADIATTVMALLPGLMWDFPGPGKLSTAAAVASAESNAAYFTFEQAVLQAAFALKKAYYELHFLDAKIEVNRAMLRLVGEIEQLARAQNDAGKVTLQDVLRAQIEHEQLTTEIENLDDSRLPLRSQFKAALGLKADDATPPLPEIFESTELALNSDQLFAAALKRNPRLKAMEADVRRADASLRLAFKARIPDFSLGAEADVKASPTVVMPQIGVTLPVWREKIAAQIASAQSGKRASEARLSAEQITLAVEFAEKTFMVRESSRSLDLLTTRLLPKARQALEVARSGYVSGKINFLDLIEAERTLLEFRLAEVEARVQRELALAELSLVILGTPPAHAPVLPANALAAKATPP
jgi:outer membrane protein TolC